MSPRRQATNIAASVRARLSELARRRGVEFQLVLSEFSIERLLYRLGASRHAERFVLKGATLLKLWSDEMRRATWPQNPEELIASLRRFLLPLLKAAGDSKPFETQWSPGGPWSETQAE